jgi:5-methylcytosine-specific restriction protein A
VIKPPTFRSKAQAEIMRQNEAMRSVAKAPRYGSDWRKVRFQKLRMNPICELCHVDHIITEATVVHHLIDVAERPDLRLEMSNLQSLCKSHHDSITATRMPRRGK